jgi:hypothetical protein
VSILIFISLLLSVIDKLMHSECAAACGYTIDKPQIVNPLDSTLNALAKVTAYALARALPMRCLCAA